MAIGRLDVNSEGLLLLTTDGKVSEYVRGRKVEKEYYVQVDGCIGQQEINRLIKGVEIGFDGKKYITKSCKSSLISEPSFKDRTQKKSGCPHCDGRTVSVTNSLISLFPKIAAEWHPAKNGNTLPKHVPAGSKKKVWWKCKIDPIHEWEAE